LLQFRIEIDDELFSSALIYGGIIAGSAATAAIVAPLALSAIGFTPGGVASGNQIP
jgi:hypothetical protein